MRRDELRELERILKALANVNRLALLADLQKPQRYTEVRLAPSRAGPGSAERPIARQAVKKHLLALKGLDLVVAAPGPGTSYVLNHARLFGALEQLRALTQVAPTAASEGMRTVDLDAAPRAPDIAGPQLVLVRGVREGRAFALTSDRAGPEGAWVLGRKRECAVSLDYDPYVSGAHAHVVRRDGRFFLVDLPGNRNGTFLNWKLLARGALAELKAGDVVGVGRSLLVFRA